MKNSYRSLVGKSVVKRQCGRPRCEDNIKMSLKYVFKKPGYLSGIALGYGLDDRGFESRQGLGIFLFTTASRSALGPTHPPIQWLPAGLSLRVKRPGNEAYHSPPSSAEVKNAWNYARVYRKVSGLAVWSENCKWYNSLPLDAVVSQFCESV
jgi:hypothetical protein